MRLVRKLISSCAMLTVCTMAAEAKVTLPALMGDGMDLQRNATVNIWGSSDKGRTIKVRTSWDGRTYKTRAADDGSWSVSAQTSDAGGPP